MLNNRLKKCIDCKYYTTRKYNTITGRGLITDYCKLHKQDLIKDRPGCSDFEYMIGAVPDEIQPNSITETILAELKYIRKALNQLIGK